MATTYVVLKETTGALGPEDRLWYVIGTADGDTPREAVKTYAEPEGESPIAGHYAAVPVRNWSEETAEPETRVKYESSGYVDRRLTIARADDLPEVEELAAVIGEVGVEPGESA